MREAPRRRAIPPIFFVNPPHTVRAYADEEPEPFSWSTVFVTTLGEEFTRGLSGEYELDDFPAPGQSVTVEWRQEQQNFVITDMQ